MIDLSLLNADILAQAAAQVRLDKNLQIKADENQIREWIKFACEANNYPELILQIHYEWNHRYTNKAGTAHYRHNLIKLSAQLWDLCDTKERRQTVIHECSHLIAYYKYWTQRKQKGETPHRIDAHGYEWRQIMRKCGIQPRRCHNINREGLVRRTEWTKYQCSCGQIYQLSQHRITKMQNGHRYICRICRRQIIVKVPNKA